MTAGTCRQGTCTAAAAAEEAMVTPPSTEAPRRRRTCLRPACRVRLRPMALSSRARPRSPMCGLASRPRRRATTTSWIRFLRLGPRNGPRSGRAPASRARATATSFVRVAPESDTIATRRPQCRPPRRRRPPRACPRSATAATRARSLPAHASPSPPRRQKCLPSAWLRRGRRRRRPLWRMR